MPHKYLFFNDYSEGAHPNILKLMSEVNLNQEVGYGEDTLSLKASNLIKKKLNNQKVQVHFVSGGTQANLVVLGAILKPYESVIAAGTAHISVHEAGAIEATGHKINTIKTEGGKITSGDIKIVLDAHTDEHMVKPKVVFISQSTEVGTLYSKLELKDISNFCRENNLYLYLDGARLGSAIASSGNDLELSDIASLVDIFYIGGTKNGALLGEAIVICNPDLQKDFRYHLKQRGALLAKGTLIATQFVALFEQDLYTENAKHANDMAKKLTDGIKSFGCKFLTESSTNQIFPILPNHIIEKLKENYGFYVWSKFDTANSVIRLVTSWATKESAVEEFLVDLKKAS
jgi:threonine aldolase